jgi:hypothetical protein
VQTYSRLGPLASGEAIVGRLDTVVYRVAHQMEEWISEVLKHAAIELRLVAPHLPPDLFPEGTSEISNGTMQLIRDRRHRHHPHAHGAFLEIVQHSRELSELGDTGRIHAETFRQHAPHSHLSGR